MNAEAPYRDPLLTVETLALMLNVEPRRLSYHLHEHLSTSFPKYISEWRLKSVCLDLKRRPEESIFNVALDNGFNSKSNFNALFVKTYGKTPSQFRDETHRGK
jgi:AraC-like DNA-binding protein